MVSPTGKTITSSSSGIAERLAWVKRAWVGITSSIDGHHGGVEVIENHT